MGGWDVGGWDLPGGWDSPNGPTPPVVPPIAPPSGALAPTTLPTQTPVRTTPTLAQLPLYGRKYQLVVKFPPDEQGNQTVINIADSSFEPEALRITFDVYRPGWEVFWYADISIYNLDSVTTAQLLGNGSQGPSGVKQGMEVVLSAGYQNGNFGVIYDGFVLQPMWDRENVTDFKITLHCVIGLNELIRNPIYKTYATISQQELVSRMAKDCFRPVDVASVSSAVSTQLLPRGRTVFGNINRYINWIAEDNNAQSWLTAKGVTLASLDKDVEVDQSKIRVFTPNTGLVGTPEQTQFGANFRLLLDPLVEARKPFMQVKLDNAVIRQQKKQIGVLPGLLDQDGQYIVLATRYIGDTRGNDWYTDVTGITSLNGKAALLNIIGASINQ